MPTNDNRNKNNENARNPYSSAKKSKKKLPLWLVIARALYRFFSGAFRKIKSFFVFLWSAVSGFFKKAADFIVDFFTGLPDGIRYLRNKKKTERSFKRIRREQEKKQKKEAEKEEKQERRALARSESLKLSKQKKLRREARKTPKDLLKYTLGVILLSCLLFYLVAIPAIVGGVYLADHIRMPKKAVTVSATVGGVKQRSTLPAARAYPLGDDTLYINMDSLAQRLGLSAVSNGKTVHYTLPCGQKAALTSGSSSALLNGSAVSLSSPVLISGGTVWVPLELLTKYTDGLAISFSKNVLTIVQENQTVNGETLRTTYKEFRFTICGIEPAPLPEIVYA